MMDGRSKVVAAAAAPAAGTISINNINNRTISFPWRKRDRRF
jgi:hypothetical protein